MKFNKQYSILRSILGTLSLLTVMTLSAHAVELSSASNEQLLGELQRRLKTGTEGSSSVATYFCTGLTLNLENTGASIVKQISIYLGDSDSCLKQAKILSAYKSKITSTTIIAVCNGLYLKRYPFLPTGEVGKEQSSYIGDSQSCLDQATQINQGE